jgi:hypothetical protein
VLTALANLIDAGPGPFVALAYGVILVGWILVSWSS